MPKPQTILIVDDVPAMRKVLALRCQQAGFEATIANDGIEALECALSACFHIVITDYQMPKMDGVELCKRLRSVELYKTTPVIMFTSIWDFLDTEALKQQLNLVVLPKPVDLAGFPQLLDRTVQGRVR